MRKTQPEVLAKKIIDKEQKARKQTQGILNHYLNGKHKQMKQR